MMPAEPPSRDLDLPEPYRSMLEKRRIAVFGDSLKDLLASKSATIQILSDSDPVRRRAALRLLYECWDTDPSEEEMYRRITLTDPDPEMRAEALRCWSRLYSGSHDVAFSKILADMVAQESETLEFRSAAYLALCRVQWISVPSLLEFYKSCVYDKGGLPKELDWEIVNKFR